MDRNVIDFGADPTGEADSWDAFNAACNEGWDSISGLNQFAGGLVFVPRGYYYLSKPLHLIRRVNLVGAGMFNTVLKFDGAGIINHNHLTSAAEELTGASGDCVVSDMTLMGGYVNVNNGEPDRNEDNHGFDMRSSCTLRNLWVTEFAGNGVNINTDDQNRNANRFLMERVRCSKNKNGFYIKGDDSNAGVLLNCDGRTNREWGFWEQSFLGNCYLGCHVGYNEVGAVNSIRHTAKNTYINFYQEGSNVTHPIVMTAGDCVVGGISFQYTEITQIAGGGRPTVINQNCGPLEFRDGNHTIWIGGEDLIAFRRGTETVYRFKYRTDRKTLGLYYANTPTYSMEFADTGHASEPMTITRVRVADGAG